MSSEAALTTEHVLERRQVLPVDLEDAFAFFADARHLEAITPSWLAVPDSPGSASAGLVAAFTVWPWLRAIFDYRAGQTAALLR